MAAVGEQALRPSRSLADCHHLLKIVLCSNRYHAIQALLIRYHDGYYTSHNATLGPAVDFKVTRLQLDGHTVKVQNHLLHHPNQPGDRPASFHYMYNGTTGLMFALDTTDESATDRVRRWMQTDVQSAGRTERGLSGVEGEAKTVERDPNIARLLVATNVDAQNRVVSRAAGEALAAEFGVAYAETSAATGEGVREAFELMAAMANETWKAAEVRRNEVAAGRERGEQAHAQQPSTSATPSRCVVA